MRLIKCAKQFVIAGVVAGICSISQAQSGGGGTPVWTKVLDTSATPRTYYVEETIVGYLPYEVVTREYLEAITCWDTINEEPTLTAPWTSTYTNTFVWTPIARVTRTANSSGAVLFKVKWEDCTGTGEQGTQRWLYNPTNKKKERQIKWNIVAQNSNGGS